MYFLQCRNEFRAIVVGGGTDGGSAFLGEQLNHTNNAEVIYFDFSYTSMSFAKRAIRVRKLNNVVFVIEWIEGIPHLGLGEFSLVFCTGVLHHLKSPTKGLTVLKNILSFDGGGSIMVYGKFGRTGVYQLQDVLRSLNENEDKLETTIKNAKSVLNVLPKSNWFQKMQHIIPDHTDMGDNGIYDLLLHTRDVSYSLPEVDDWLRNSNLNFIDYTSNTDRVALSLNIFIQDNAMHRRLSKTSNIRQKSIAEMIVGDVIKHEFYVSKSKEPKACVEEPGNVFFLFGNPTGLRTTMLTEYNLVKLRNQTYMCAAFIKTSKANGVIKNGHSRPFVLPINEFSDYILNYLIRRPELQITLHRLISSFQTITNSSKTFEHLHNSLKEMLPYLTDTGFFLLRKPTVGLFPKTCCTIQFSVIGFPNCLDYTPKYLQ